MGSALFIHRYAEKASRASRKEEIDRAVQKLSSETITFSDLAVIPVCMTEAWLFFSESALRRAAGNPHGKGDLSIPSILKLEKYSDPKKKLDEVLKRASGLSGGNLKRFDCNAAKQRLAGVIDDWSPLGQLSALKAMQKELLAYCMTINQT